MKRINEIVVVEGKTDSQLLKELYDVDTIETHGLGLDDKTLELIKEASKTRGVIVLTDPDYPGLRIRNQVEKYVQNCKHAFVDRKDAIGKKKLGIAEANKESVKKATVKTENKTVVPEKTTDDTTEESNRSTIGHKKTAMIVKISSVEPNVNQPRKQFDEDALLELSESIKQYGVLQPLLVSDKKDYYEIIAGERRWRAAKLAGLKEIPVIVKEFSEQELVEISLIENIQREDLNPVEEAMAYKRLIDEFHLKQDEIAERVGKSRTAVTNAMRLLKLSEKVQQMLIDEMITAGHARAILSIADKEKQESIAMKIFDEKLSVRETEALVKRMLEPPKTAKKSKFSSAEDAIYESLEEKMKSIMGTRVQIHRKKNDKGKIEIEYYSKDELERIIDLFESIG